MFDLHGEVAVITGGTGYLGYTMAEALSEHGAIVVIAGRIESKCKKTAKEISDKTGNLCIGIELDISSIDSVSKGLQVVSQEFSSFNILINNAYYSSANNLEEITIDEWHNGLDGTVTGTMYCIQKALPYMKESTQFNRSIINIASMYGIVSPNPAIYGDTGYDNPPNYGAGKAAVIQLTKYSACHLAKYNIRVNSISPGPFPFPSVQENSWFIKQLEDKVPLKRIGEPTDLKGSVVFLASGASSYITGHNLVVDGGWTAW